MENASRKYRLLEDVESFQVMVGFLSLDDFSTIFADTAPALPET